MKCVPNIPVLVVLAAAGAGFYIIAGPGAAGASEARSTLLVGATVEPVARIQRESQPAEIVVSATDVRRGYVDVAQPTSLEINSNSPNGIALDLTPLNPMMQSMIVSGLESEQALGAEGGTLVRRWQRPQSLQLSLRFKLMLAPGVEPGRYAWPLHLHVRPL